MTWEILIRAELNKKPPAEGRGKSIHYSAVQPAAGGLLPAVSCGGWPFAGSQLPMGRAEPPLADYPQPSRLPAVPPGGN